MNERTNQPKTFEEWYAKYPDLASYMQSMRDAFAAGLEACDCAAALRAKEQPELGPCPRHGKEFWVEVVDTVFNSMAAHCAACKKITRLVLEEAKWWRYLVIMHDESYFAVEGDKRIASLTAQAENEKP